MNNDLSRVPAIERLESEGGKNLAEVIAIRRDIHRHPELGFEEVRTGSIVASKLEEWGFDVFRDVAGTGVIGRLKNGPGSRSLGIRADMDALPIEEATNLPYGSSSAGKMHACGHDGHTAILLGAAQHIAETRRFSGTLNLIFQPAEEGRGGAKKMIEEGVFERFPCDAIFALHNAPGIPTGNIHLKSGPMMASVDTAVITLTGIGGHGAMPHLSKDPLIAAASIVMALQTIVSRNVDPQDAAVVTVGSFHGGDAVNVIPQAVVLKLGMRALRPATRELLFSRVRSLVEAQANSFDVKASILIEEGQPVLVNDPACARLANEVAVELLGRDRVVSDQSPMMASEDFAWMLAERPGCYLLLGNGSGSGPGSCMVHNPKYDFNDEALPTGIAYWSLLAERFLN